MNRAERRDRTEKIRTRRIRQHRWIDEWRTFRSADAHRNFLKYWVGNKWSAERSSERIWADYESDVKERTTRDGKMRTRYVVGYRDDDYWLCGVRDKLRSADVDFAEGLDEAGLPQFFRPWRSRQYL